MAEEELRRTVNTAEECVRLAEEHAAETPGCRTVIFRRGTFVRVFPDELDFDESEERYARQRLREAAYEGVLRREQLEERSEDGDVLCLAYQSPSLSGNNGVFNLFWVSPDRQDEDEALIAEFRAADMDETEVIEVI